MESLANYASDDESTDFNDSYKGNRRTPEEDANYDDIGMDESSEESNNNNNNNQTENDRHDRRNERRTSGDSRHFPMSHVTEDGSHDRNSSRAYDDRPRHSGGWRQVEPKREDQPRRNSSDMEMDDGEDELDNFTATGNPNNSASTSTGNKPHNPADNRSSAKRTAEEEHRRPGGGDKHAPGDAKARHEERTESAASCKSRDDRLKEWDKQREEKSREHEGRKDKSGRSASRRDSDERRGGGSEKRRSPDRREDRRKRSHSPDRRDRDRDRRSRRSSRSPDRMWKMRKLERKAAVLNKLGIELKTELPPGLGPRGGFLGEHLRSQIQEVEARTGVTLPTYYNPGVMNPLKYAQQIQKRKLLWGNKSGETKQAEAVLPTPNLNVVQQWEGTTFKGDNDGKMTEKFKRLMGMKTDGPQQQVASTSSGTPVKGEIIQKQEEMFSNMEAQYQVARMATHTHRGLGLGFGTFQVTPR